jgi:hypothetical protein
MEKDSVAGAAAATGSLAGGDDAPDGGAEEEPDDPSGPPPERRESHHAWLSAAMLASSDSRRCAYISVTFTDEWPSSLPTSSSDQRRPHHPQSRDPLKVWAAAIEKRRGKRIAVVALARRLAGVLWAMWRDGTVYDPTTVGKASARGTIALAESTEHRAKQIARATVKSKRFARSQRRHHLEEVNP